MLETFERLESDVRGYCRSFPTIFERAKGAELFDREGRRYIDFFAGAGVMNYGHNDPCLKEALLEYLAGDGLVHSLDMASGAKETFLQRFEEVLLKPRGLDYVMQFPGPTGTNAVEAALKLARKVTGRTNVVSFTRGFHGMTLGSLAVTGNAFKRAGAGVPLHDTVSMPFDGYLGDEDTIGVLEAYLADSGSGVDAPAAVILETVQAEGGVNVASFDWLKRLQDTVHRHGALLIVDDIQVGCGRTGPFFSFEPAGIKPDMVCLSKSLSGFGLPFALVLFRKELDQWAPGEHNGTFRGHLPAMVTATAALGYWKDDSMTKGVERRRDAILARLEALANRHGDHVVEVRGRGLIQAVEFKDHSVAGRVSKECFERGVIIETAGPSDETLKLLPPLTIDEAHLEEGLDVIEQGVDAAIASAQSASKAAGAA